MRLSEQQHLAYCMNVFPFDTPEALFDGLPKFATELRNALGEKELEIAVGLWFPAKVASALIEEPETLEKLKSLLKEHRLYVPTLNAFPYGKFHGTEVKTAVYSPDWSTPERLRYTLDCAVILEKLLPDSLPFGAISTLPLGYRSMMDNAARSRAKANIETLAESLVTSRIRIAVEPEPGCEFETYNDFKTFWDTLSDTAKAVIGLCHDTAHAEVMDAPLPARIEIPVWKIQLSAALGYTARDNDFSQIQPFREPVYLHQTRIGDTFYHDIPDNPDFIIGKEAVIHYHLPLFADMFAKDCRTLKHEAQRLLTHRIEFALQEMPPILEIETYTWRVVPETFRGGTIIDGIAREYRWVFNTYRQI